MGVRARLMNEESPDRNSERGSIKRLAPGDVLGGSDPGVNREGAYVSCSALSRGEGAAKAAP